jgi:hypothetical protein
VDEPIAARQFGVADLALPAGAVREIALG